MQFGNFFYIPNSRPFSLKLNNNKKKKSILEYFKILDHNVKITLTRINLKHISFCSYFVHSNTNYVYFKT